MKKISLYIFLGAGLLIMLTLNTRQAQAASSVHLLSPNGGESYTQGQPFTIQWEQSEVDMVTIGIARYDCKNFGSIATVYTDIKATNGSYLWDNPVSTEHGNDLKICLQAYKIGTYDSAQDGSDDFITILQRSYAPLNVVLSSQTPNGTDIPKNGQFYNIAKFSVTNSSNNPSLYFTIFECQLVATTGSNLRDYMNTRIYDNDTKIWESTHSSTCDANGYRALILPGETKTVRVDISVDSSYPATKANFAAELRSLTAETLDGQSLPLISPNIKAKLFSINGGVSVPNPSPVTTTGTIYVSTPSTPESWKSGDIKTINWQAQNLPSSAGNKINLSFFNASDGTMVGSNLQLPNSGSAQITVPALTVGGIYKIRIMPACSDNLNCVVKGESTGTITIISGAAITEPSEAKNILASGKNLDNYLLYRKIKKSTKDQDYAMKTFTNPLTKREKISLQEKYAINNFIVYGTASTNKLNAKKRYELLLKFKKTYGKSPKTEADWKNIIK